MVLSLLARHSTLGATATLAARVALPATPSVLTRRTFLATPHFEFPPATTKPEGAKTTSKKSTSTKTAEKATSTKAAKTEKSPTKKGSSAKVAKKDEKPKATIPKKDMPPKRPPGSFLLFFISYLKSQPKVKTLEETQALSKRASEVWKTYSIAEKQPFYDEHEVLKEQFKKERIEYFRNTSITTLKEINKSRRARGKLAIRRVTDAPRPITAFLWFVSDFRKSTDGQSILTQTVPGKNHNVQLITAAGERWRSMSAEEQSPYFEKSRKAREEFNEARQAATA
ncbi:hypothetical protein BDN67DRAFT_967125 [Paxillus ammoniavirescens]|nr:hypothetical protein BDN67DRAFT_967125 [Paxillus ammoniavirescens]